MQYIRMLSTEGRAGVREIMKRRLDSRTRGILEISTRGNIDFLHRTASDWILQPRIWEGICSEVPEDFDPYLQLLRAETIQIPGISSNLVHLTSKEALQVIRFLVLKVFWYASQVKRSPACDPELILILDKLDQEVDQVFRDVIKRERDETIYARYMMQEGFHWASLQLNLWPGHQITFLSVMATFCILPYIRAKIPSGLNQKASNRHATLLLYAMFGYEESSYHIELKQRIATVAFLLEHGVSRKTIISNGRPIIDEVRKRKETTDEDEKDYLIRVEELLSPKRSLKESLKTRFQRAKRR